ncbi:acetyl-CoA carboxylase, carboxyltransferase, alpha subunit [Campylobacter ureolyticus RIGS 9880]|uniref:Acetyl-coenzyme A carboxylase carboxyl transferase subunit alpha n=2 Tax=Campylobacter ureolyticus TaxID=827 RepID=A0A381EDI6_9BACT|nr:acetyl-CoA carboxylase carboxyl transferase subunit alpha [Campylobacter ureolyticus]AKT90048.1 acetyl-CoA carboxylase, carboxyltransferase, alpha subunit [Campylobacter ureolyticus RIGS 9880]MCR8684958.1 acetyl-CoA carboxylase carboxyl transferase subunit alpha [Campylobacter ureolyticus]MCR8699848.1 acetyl-CoA carboxylase carboxyl transferase subunit alpha [Campylobacter ureolyticus]MCZ6103425.1 acetyl-CoA carboxylase carboxyl transferase subunit alpha [Campylobacter ureolyticus]MCZ611137
MANYLDFEKGIKQIDEEISSAKIRGDDDAVEILNKNLEKEVVKTYKNLSEYQRLQLARHPDRPYSLDYIKLLLKDGYEIHGDRAFRDDPAIVCFIGYMADRKVVIIGEEKGRGTKNKIKRNFGMPNPEGYRKALRVAKMAEKFNLPILFLIDTPGAYPGVGAEERGQSEAIAKNLYEFSSLKVPMISVVIGEGGSGGALAIGVSDKLAMMQNSIFSVISPEGCAAILWNDPTKSELATKAMKITASELKEHKLIDDVIQEPKTGAHRDKESAIKEVGEYFLKELSELEKLSVDELLEKRMEKILSIGAYKER